MQVHLVDGTYELFRHYFALPSRLDTDGVEVAAVRGVLGSILGMLEDGATHVGVATDHVVESFRNEMWDGYKSGEGLEPELMGQFHPLENALGAMGVTVWPMVEFEADDALASAATVARKDDRVERILLCTPDKDLAQSVDGDRIVQLDRRKNLITNEAGVIEKYGVPPGSIPDYLALVGDTSDGFPGLPGWGAKSTATVLGHYQKLDEIPDDVESWARKPRGAARLALALSAGRDEARLFKDLATLRTDVAVGRSVDEWEWKGPSKYFAPMCEKLGARGLAQRAQRIARRAT